MEERINRMLSGLCAVTSDLAVVCLPVASMTVLFGMDASVRYFVWTGFLLIQLLVNEGMISMGAPLNLYLVWNAVVSVAGAYLATTAFTATYGVQDLTFLFGTCGLGIAVHGSVCSYFHHGSNGLSRYVDILILEIAFYLYSVSYLGKSGDGELLAFSLLVLVIDLFTISRLRTREGCRRMIRGSGIGTGIVAAAAVGVCLLAAGTAAGIASGQIHSAVDAILVIASYIWRIVSAIGSAIGFVLGHLIMLLILLMPATPQYARENVMARMDETTSEILEETGFLIPDWVLALVLAVGAVVGIGLILYRLRGVRFRRPEWKKTGTRVTKKNHFFEELVVAFARLRERLHFAYLCRRYRRTAAGVFLLAERIGHSIKMSRKPSESPGAYVRRLAGVWENGAKPEVDAVSRSDGTAGGSELASLLGLADMLERVFYAGQSIRLTDEEYRKYRSVLKRTGEIAKNTAKTNEKTDAKRGLLC